MLYIYIYIFDSFIPKDHQRVASVLPLVLSKTKPVSPGFLLRRLRFQMPSAATQVIKIIVVHGSARSATKRLTLLIIKAFFFLELESQDQAPVQADGDNNPWVARKKQQKQQTRERTAKTTTTAQWPWGVWGGMEAFTVLATNVTLRYVMFLLHVSRYVTLRYNMFAFRFNHRDNLLSDLAKMATQKK